MGVKTASSHPFSILPRLGFPPSHKTESSSRSPRVDKPEEDWYIPYNGPLEPPKSVSLAKQDIVRHPVSQDDVNTHLEDSQLLYRYRDMSVNDAKPLGLGPPPVQLAGYPRTRIHSDLTRRTASSSSAIDPTRPHPRRHQTSAPRLQILTHTSMDAGVGESPMPAQRIGISNPRKKMSRFFGFGSSKKPKGQSISTPVSPISRTNVPGAWLPSSTQHSTIQDNVNFAKPPNSSPDKGNRFDSHYSTLPRPSQRSHTHHHRPRIDTVDLSSSKQFSARHVDFHGKPDQDSLLSSPATNYDSPTIFMAHSSHPYANTSSSVSVSALRPGISQQSHQGHQQLDSSAYNTQFSHNQTRRSRALTYAIDPRSHRAVALDKHARPLASPLKPSVSTPNLSATSHGKQPSQQSTKSTPPVSGVDRWLSPETWCDALFFPRPRLRSERAHGQYGGSSGRIISPPITPVAEGASPRLSPALRGGRPQVSSATHDVRKEHHVLLKSRSAVDILSGPSISGRPRTASTPQQRPDPDPDPARNISPKEEESVPGPSTAQQELRPSASVPSLTQVLEEGEVLEAQRKRWQHQASHSFGNSRTRSLSRARARSLSRSHSRPGHKQEGSTTLEYLAARTLLGAQSIAPAVNAARSSHSRSHSHSHSQTHSNSRGRSSSYSFTGSQSHSLGKSNSQKSLSDPQSTRHVRNESWGKTALLKACAPCGDLSDLLGTPVDKRPALGPATEETNVIHLSDPAGGSHNGAGEESVIIIGISPAPTTASGEGVGIALSSPPPVDDRSSHDPELTSMPSHPYATGAIYTRYNNPSSEHGLQHVLKVSDYAGPHPSAYDPQLPPNIATSGVSMRHRLPPRAMQPGAISHPYAAASSEPVNSHARQPSNSAHPTLLVPPSAVQEDHDFTSNNHISISSPDFEKYGIGEALVFAAPSRDEQETDSEDQSITIIPCQQDTLSRIKDKGKAKEMASMASGNSHSRIPVSDSVIVSTRPPSLISVTAVGGRDSTHPPDAHRPTTSITSAHLVISALDHDDLDEFQDLFYRPPQSRLSSGKSSVKHQEASETSRGIPSDIHSSYSGSALTNLMRSMSEIGELHVEASDLSHGQRSGGVGESRSDELSQTYVFMDMSRTPSPVQANPRTVSQSPAQLYDAPFESGVPEDIESSRASSFLMASQENDTFGLPIRQDVVDAAGTSTILQGSYRSSAHASIYDAAEEADLVSPISFIHSPLLSAGGIRSSYMTSGSEYSRMSTLSDFPDPPAQPNPNVTLNSASILQIYVDAPDSTPLQQPENVQETDCPQPGSGSGSGSRVFSLESHRTTFGGSDDIDIITRVHSQV